MLKPHDLVLLEHKYEVTGTFYLIAEIISKETPDETIMVRTVPGEPETMIEVSLDRIRRPRYMKPKFVHYAVITVGKSCHFPVDMFRYDNCTPVNFKLDDEDQVIETNDEELIVGQCNETKSPNFHPDRWLSFGCRIKYIKTLKLADVCQLAE